MEFVLGGIVGVALLLWVLILLARRHNRRQRQQRTAPKASYQPVNADTVGADKLPADDPRTIGPDSVVIVGIEEFVVTGEIVHRQGGFMWKEFRLDGGAQDGSAWLSVEDDEGLEVILWRTKPDPGFGPNEREVAYDGHTYRRTEYSSSQYTAAGVDAVATSGNCRYADYEGPENLRLSFEQFPDGSWEFSTGEVVTGIIEVAPPGNVRLK